MQLLWKDKTNGYLVGLRADLPRESTEPLVDTQTQREQMSNCSYYSGAWINGFVSWHITLMCFIRKTFWEMQDKRTRNHVNPWTSFYMFYLVFIFKWCRSSSRESATLDCQLKLHDIYISSPLLKKHNISLLLFHSIEQTLGFEHLQLTYRYI